jgi:hypothetical protein
MNTHTMSTMLPCFICTKLGQEFIAQTVHRVTLDNGLSKIMFPCCVAHQELSEEELEDILRGGE